MIQDSPLITYIINATLTAFTSSGRAFTSSHTLHQKWSDLVCFHVMLNGRSRQWLETLETKSARIVTQMQMLLSVGFCVTNLILSLQCSLVLIWILIAPFLVVQRISVMGMLSYACVRKLQSRSQNMKQMPYLSIGKKTAGQTGMHGLVPWSNGLASDCPTDR